MVGKFMRTKTLVGLFCCLTIASSQISCRHNTVENQEGAQQMPKLTIEQVQEKHQDQLMAISGVGGVGIGAVDGKPVILVLVIKKTPELEQRIPKMLEGYPVVIQETGEVRALKRDSG